MSSLDQLLGKILEEKPKLAEAAAEYEALARELIRSKHDYQLEKAATWSAYRSGESDSAATLAKLTLLESEFAEIARTVNKAARSLDDVSAVFQELQNALAEEHRIRESGSAAKTDPR
jgi:hypothetical protein